MWVRLPPGKGRRLAAWAFAAFLALAAVVPEAASLGKKDKKGDADEFLVEESKKWVYAVTAFDVSALPATERLIGELTARRLAREIAAVGLRSRSPEEAEAYADYADDQAQEAAGTTLAKKRQDRAALLFDGNPRWKYRKELAKADAAVDAAEDALLRVERARSKVEVEAEIALSEKDVDGALPPEPAEALRGLFCTENKVDALLTGSVEPYYGRFRLRIRLYSRYLREVFYEDETVFSSEDRDAAVAELSGRLRLFIGGVPPAAIAVTATPEDADIVVDGKILGRGSVGPLEKRPAPARVEVSSPFHEPADLTVDLTSGELSEVSFALKPLGTEALSVSALFPPEAPPIEEAGTAEARDVGVRLGALYEGNAPVVLTVPTDALAYVVAETKDGWGASAVVSGGGSLTLDLKPLPGPEDKPVELARRRFYGAFGRFSIALPIAFFMSGLATVYENAVIWSGDPEKQDAAESMRLWANVAVGITVSFFAEAAVRCAVYLHAANERATPLLRPARKNDTQEADRGR